MQAAFKNEPFTNFNDPQNNKAMRDALAKVRSEFGRKYPCVIGGKRVETGDLLESRDPSSPSTVLGYVHRATEGMVSDAIDAAWKAFPGWSRKTAEERARYLFALGALLRRRKHEMSAWLVYEVGKSWAEADGDVAETIDFCEFYGREAVRYAAFHPLTPSPIADEHNEVFYIPLGVGAVIPPWNFPAAILGGMTLASIVSGNTVVLKPSSDSPVIAAKFCELLEEVSLPPGVVNFLPGSGGKVGDPLVLHPKTRYVAFTGSMEVGLRINELAARKTPGQVWLKRVVLEMGGKDCIVVDATADLESAADGIVAAAFGFSGQKCSACSRVIAEAPIYDRLLEMVVERTKRIKVGPVEDFSNFMGPVVNKTQYDSMLEYIEIGKKEGRIVAGGGAIPTKEKGYFIEPTIVADLAASSRIAQEEIFGPVLGFVKAADFEDAMAIANGTQYGLTGSLYSRERTRLERARRELHVGNLYLNRKCTGALVDVHPFGGFNMSGTDSKGGGRDYLLLFTQAKSVAEKF